MPHPDSRSLFADRPLSARVAAADTMRIEMLRCVPNSTVRCKIPKPGLTLVWTPQVAAPSGMRLGHDDAYVALGGQANLSFFPDGHGADGSITVTGDSECVSIFLDASSVPIQLRETLQEPRVGFRHVALGRAFRELTHEMSAPDDTFPVFSLGWAMQALAYVARSAAGSGGSQHHSRSGLAPWQLRKAQGALRTDLVDPPPLRDVAESCKLSLGHFSRAFKRSTGLTPHHWLTASRIERAKELMLSGGARLVDVAIDCGFADQSHFTRSFARHVGASPGVWRRRQQA